MKKQFFGIFLILLSGLTLALFILGAEYQYESDGSNLLTETDQILSSKQWKIHHKQFARSNQQDGSVTLSITPSKKTQNISVWQKVNLNSSKRLKIKGEIKADQIIVEPITWHGGRVILVSLSAEGKPFYHYPHVATKVFDTNGWEKFSAVFRIKEDINTVRAGFQIVALSGSMMVRGIELIPVKASLPFKVITYFLMCGWGVLVFFGLLHLYKRFSEINIHKQFLQKRGHVTEVHVPPFKDTAMRKYETVFPIIVILMILIGVLTPKPIYDKLFEEIKQPFISGVTQNQDKKENLSIRQTGDQKAQKSGLIFVFSRSVIKISKDYIQDGTIKKTGHLVFFALLILSLNYVNRNGYPILQLVYICTFVAYITEMLQFLSEGRQASFFDFSIDMLGVGVGLVLIKLRIVRAGVKGRGQT